MPSSDLDDQVSALLAALRLKFPRWTPANHEAGALFLHAPDGIAWWKVRAASSGYRPVILLTHRASAASPVARMEFSGDLAVVAARAAFDARRESWVIEAEASGHRRDAECDVDPATMECRGCGVENGDPCEICGGRAFHRLGCTASAETTEQLRGLEVRTASPSRPTDPCAEGVIVDVEGRLFTVLIEGEEIVRDAEEVEPAQPEKRIQASSGVRFEPWVEEHFAGTLPDRSGWVVARRGLMLTIRDRVTGRVVERLDVGAIFAGDFR